ncbi:hypothetical protein TL16_g08973 [Triparma laevis f. inornata]|uniref:Protein disulfide isomerase n=1 Tax=Triparma laevis f. inornata TaxID=1714386 RepID=A0A9W7EHU0_9STRA|nr:hypothetical protein TL16_g08973 [Triparma laevis f. inornata]
MTSAPDPPPLPCLFWKDSKRASYNFYDDVHTLEAISSFIDKQMAKPITALKTIDEVTSFISEAVSNNHISLVGFFTDSDMQDDEIEDFTNYAKKVHSNSRVYCGIVEDEEVSRYFMKELKWFDRPPAVVLTRPKGDINLLMPEEEFNSNNTYHTSYLLDLETTPLSTWVLANSLPPVTYLTPYTFTILASIGKPMVLCFLDWKSSTSGNLPNSLITTEIQLAAREYSKDVRFVIADGSSHLDRMAVVGVKGGMSALPAIVINGNDRRTEVFPEELPINGETIGGFIAGFLKGKGGSMALAASKRNKRNQVIRDTNNEEEVDKVGQLETMDAESDSKVRRELNTLTTMHYY